MNLIKLGYYIQEMGDEHVVFSGMRSGCMSLEYKRVEEDEHEEWRI
jgi:tRNA splicing endonuclease